MMTTIAALYLGKYRYLARAIVAAADRYDARARNLIDAGRSISEAWEQVAKEATDGAIPIVSNVGRAESPSGGGGGSGPTVVLARKRR